MNRDEITEDELTQWQNEDVVSQSEPSSNINLDFESVRVVKSNNDYNLDYLISSIQKNIDLGPDYQRRSRWSKIKQSQLIESFLLNIPVPPIFLFEKEYYEYEVIDGRQRLEAIKAYINNEFRLTGCEYLLSLDGKAFKDLPDQTQKLLYRRTITATILLVESKSFDKWDLRMILFNRLNTGGEKLNGQELRNAIHASRFNDLILELSATPSFRELWDIPNPDNETDFKLIKKLEKSPLYKTMMDCELVLRFFAIRKVCQDELTNGSMKVLLDDTMKQNRKLDEIKLERLRSIFLDTLETATESFGQELILNPILEPSKKARNLYDSLFVGISLVERDKLQSKEIVLKNIKKVLEQATEYEKIITKGNSIENIKYRVSKAKEILTERL